MKSSSSPKPSHPRNSQLPKAPDRTSRTVLPVVGIKPPAR